jgi:hypothetical protein
LLSDWCRNSLSGDIQNAAGLGGTPSSPPTCHPSPSGAAGTASPWYTNNTTSSHEQQQHQLLHHQKQQLNPFRLDSVIRRDSSEAVVDNGSPVQHGHQQQQHPFLYRPPAVGGFPNPAAYFSAATRPDFGRGYPSHQQHNAGGHQHSNNNNHYMPYNNGGYGHSPPMSGLHHSQQQQQQQQSPLFLPSSYSNPMFPCPPMFVPPFMTGAARNGVGGVGNSYNSDQGSAGRTAVTHMERKHAKAAATQASSAVLPPTVTQPAESSVKSPSPGRGRPPGSGQPVLAGPLPAALMAAIQQEEELPELELELGVFEVSP